MGIREIFLRLHCRESLMAVAHAFRKACNAASVCSGASSGRKCRPGSALPVTFMAARACQVAMTSNIRAEFPALGPQRQHRTSNLAGAVRCIVLEIDGSAGAVIFTARVDGARIFEAAQVFSISLRRDGLRNQSGEAAAQEELSAVANERFRQGRGLDQEEPVIVRGREGLVHMLEHVISRAPPRSLRNKN